MLAWKRVNFDWFQHQHCVVYHNKEIEKYLVFFLGYKGMVCEKDIPDPHLCCRHYFAVSLLKIENPLKQRHGFGDCETEDKEIIRLFRDDDCKHEIVDWNTFIKAFCVFFEHRVKTCLIGEKEIQTLAKKVFACCNLEVGWFSNLPASNMEG